MSKSILSWLDTYGLLVASCFLLLFIPLYPKLPLFDAIPGYLVRVRLEDLLILMIGALWVFQLVRGKVAVSKTFLSLVISYGIIGFLSILSGIVLLQTIPFSPLHLGKSFLHYLRYAEYFSVFFFAYAGFKKISHVRTALWLLTATVFAITIYGYGQLYWHWPLFSTMNREFSKGVALYLTEFARVQSTFAGHYDLAAYLVLVLPILLSATLIKNHPIERLLFAGAQVAGLWLLVISGSNIALAAYLFGALTVFVLNLSRYPKLFRYSRNTALGLLIGGIAVFTTAYISDRSIPKQAIQTAESNALIMKLPGMPLALRTTKAALYPETAPAPDNALKPADVYHDIPDLVKQATVSASGEESYILVERDRTWSENAIKYGLSMGIRLDTLWPQALNGWARSLYLGSGYATLSKQGAQQFTEADSTDNNYLRSVGETGLLGFIIFLLLIVQLIRLAWPATKSANPIVASLAIGIIGATAGLLVNAVIIDVFVASKVAFTFWMLAGLAAKTVYLAHPQSAERWDLKNILWAKKQFLRHWPLLVGVALALLLLHKNPLQERSSTKDLLIAPQTIESIVTARCWASEQQWEICTDSVQFPSNTSKLYGALLLLTYSVSNNPGSFFYLNFVLALVSILFVYLISKVLFATQWLQLLTLVATVGLLFAVGTVGLPVASTIYSVLLLCIAWIVLRWQKTAVSVAGIVLGLWVLLPLPNNKLEVLHLLGPFVVVGSITIFNKIFTRKISTLQRATSFGICVSVAALVLSLSTAPELWHRQLAEYSGQLKTWRTQSIIRANQFFEGQRAAEKWSPEHPKPYLVTTIDPLFTSVYGNDLYAPLPLSAKQPYYSEVAQHFQLSDRNTLTDLYANKLAEQPVYFIDTDAHTGQFASDFAELRKNFTVWQIDSDCDEQCNLYVLRPTPPPVPTQPVSVNTKQLSATQSADFTFTIYNHRFNRSVEELTHSITEFMPMISPLQDTSLDLLFMGGDLSTVSDAGHQSYFLNFFGDLMAAPIVYTPGNYDDVEKKLFKTAPQQFQVGQTLFVTIQPAADGEIDLDQKLFLYNIVWQLEKQPDIRNVIFISNRMGWIAGNPALEPLAVALNQPLTAHDTFYTEQLLPRLTQFPEKQFYFISGDLKANPVSNVFYHREGNIQYLASATNNHASDAYLKVTLSENSEVSVVPFDGNHQQLPDITKFGVEHWRTVAPTVGTYTPPSQPSELIMLVQKVVGSSILGIVSAVLLYALSKRAVAQRRARK